MPVLVESADFHFDGKAEREGVASSVGLEADCLDFFLVVAVVA